MPTPIKKDEFKLDKESVKTANKIKTLHLAVTQQCDNIMQAIASNEGGEWDWAQPGLNQRALVQARDKLRTARSTLEHDWMIYNVKNFCERYASKMSVHICNDQLHAMQQRLSAPIGQLSKAVKAMFDKHAIENSLKVGEDGAAEPIDE